MNNKNMWVIGMGVIILAVLVSFGLLQKSKEFRSNIDPSTMEIKIGEVKSFSEVPNLSLKFVDVTEDSRCPAGYECVHIGWVTVRVEVNLDGVAVTKDISTTGGIQPSEISVGDKTIRLVNIMPIRTSPDPIKKSAYEATFSVAQGVTDVAESSKPTGGISAKIGDPAPVEEDGIVYSSHLNYVEAKNKETGKTLWKTDVYKSAEPESYDSSLETDVQLNIIRSVRVEGEILFVRDSKGTEYRLKKDTGEAL